MTASIHPTPATSCAVPGLQPFLRPIARVVIAAHLALVLQPLSVIAQPKGQSAPNPVAEAQLRRYQALSHKISQAQADKLRAALTPVDLLPEHLVRRFVSKEQDAVVVSGRVPDLDSAEILPVINDELERRAALEPPKPARKTPVRKKAVAAVKG